MLSIGNWDRVYPLRNTGDAGVYLRMKSGGKSFWHDTALSEKNKENPNRCYNYIRVVRITRERIGTHIKQSGHLCLEPQEMD